MFCTDNEWGKEFKHFLPEKCRKTLKFTELSERMGAAILEMETKFRVGAKKLG